MTIDGSIVTLMGKCPSSRVSIEYALIFVNLVFFYYQYQPKSMLKSERVNKKTTISSIL